MATAVREIRCGPRTLRLGERTLIMGILNVTPDSFAGDGLWTGMPGEADVEHVVACGRAMVADGAHILDVGGESTRPGAAPVSLDEELRRTIPVIARLAREVDVPISIDTYKAEVVRQAVAAGAGLVNDVSALRFDPAMGGVVAEVGVPLVLMHMKGTPRDMQRDPRYADVMGEIVDFLGERIAAAERAGIPRQRLIVDPGFGFGKTVVHNVEIMRRLGELRVLGCPVLIGPSRKTTIARLLGGLPATERVEGTAALVVLAIAAGVDIVRVHDVKPIARAARVADAVVRGLR
ncbi:MAG: dihydropteroate synthase [Armatimonadetes bacterium]|nr:dihydropteroate synthase [Armatimonadota bacterium]